MEYFKTFYWRKWYLFGLLVEMCVGCIAFLIVLGFVYVIMALASHDNYFIINKLLIIITLIIIN